MFLPLALPPGVHANGTELQSSGRWRDASLVRWVDGTMRPVGGWRNRVLVGSEPPRAAVAWQDLDGDRHFAVGSATKLYTVNAGGTVTDITPAGLVAGTVSAAVNRGYGGGTYGSGAYGVERPDPGTYGEATTWALDTWGEELIACSVADGVIRAWDLNVANDAVAVPNAPTDCLSAMVTDERFLFALGAGGNPRRVAWSDREDRETWAPDETNEAGDLDLQTVGQIMCGLKIKGRALILTDEDAHTATYIGPPYVYGFERVGGACGAVSRKAAALADGTAYWMGQRAFFTMQDAVLQVPCEVADAVFGGLNRAQQSKVHAVADAQFGEVWWFYPSEASIECDRYVAHNYREGHWALGSIARTAGVDRGVFAHPIWFGPDGRAYDHEVGMDHGGATPFAESGPVQLGEGDQVMSVLSLLPDEATRGDVTVTFAARLQPQGEEREYGPYAMAAPTSVRFTGRQVTMRVSGARLADWRWGKPRLDVQARGRR